MDDEKNKNYRIQLQQMISGAQENPELIPILFGKYTEALQNLAAGGDWQMSELFSPVPKNIYSLPDEFVFEFVAKHTDMTGDKLAALCKTDPKGAHKLFLSLTQLPGSLKIEGDMGCRGFMNHIAHSRFVACGRRMTKICAEGNYSAGQVFWADCGSYACTFTEGRLTKVVHSATTHSVDIDPLELLVSARWQMVDNWSDLSASFQYAGQPGLKLASLFKRDPPAGPWTIVQFSGLKQASFQSFLQSEMVQFLAAREKVYGRSDQDEVRECVKELKTEKKKETMQKAKVAAKAALKKAKDLRAAKAKTTT